MSNASLAQQVNDVQFMNRVNASAMREAWNNPEESDTPFGVALREGQVAAWRVFQWPLSIDNEAAYESALIADPPNPNPGGDPSVITDAAILSGVQAHWPEVWPPEGTTPGP